MSDDAKDYMSNHRIRIGGGELSDEEQSAIDMADKAIVRVFGMAATPKNMALQALAECIYANIAHSSKDKEQFLDSVHTFIKEFFIPQAEKVAEYLIEKMKEIKEQEKVRQYNQEIIDAIKPTGVNIIQGNSIEEILAQARVLMEQYASEQGECNCPVCTAERELAAKTKAPGSTTKH